MFIILIEITLIIVSIDLLMMIWRKRLYSEIPNVKIKFNKFIYHFHKNPYRYKLEAFNVLMKDGDSNKLSEDYRINLIFGIIDTIRYVRWNIKIMMNNHKPKRLVSDAQYKAESQVEYLMDCDSRNLIEDRSDINEH